MLTSNRGHRNQELEAAVIRATSHDERSINYKNAGRVFAWARASASFVGPLMWAIARRAESTRSWPVALKALLLAHGLLLCSNPQIGRLPFDLSDFRDRKSWGFSAFIRAYFHFLDHRSILLNSKPVKTQEEEEEQREEEDDDDENFTLEKVQKLQTLLDLLMQIRPYADGMEVGLILEAMDCVVIEIFEVYSGICNGIACFLVGILGSSSRGREGEEERRRNGLVGMRVLRKAVEQSDQLSSYFVVCRALGVLNATEFPPVDRIPEEDIRDLEKLVMGGSSENDEKFEERGGIEGQKEEEEERGTVVTEDWVVFEEEMGGKEEKQGYFGNNPFLSSAMERPWASMVLPNSGTPLSNGNLIELM